MNLKVLLGMFASWLSIISNPDYFISTDEWLILHHEREMINNPIIRPKR